MDLFKSKLAVILPMILMFTIPVCTMNSSIQEDRETNVAGVGQHKKSAFSFNANAEPFFMPGTTVADGGQSEKSSTSLLNKDSQGDETHRDQNEKSAVAVSWPPTEPEVANEADLPQVVRRDQKKLRTKKKKKRTKNELFLDSIMHLIDFDQFLTDSEYEYNSAEEDLERQELVKAIEFMIEFYWPVADTEPEDANEADSPQVDWDQDEKEAGRPISDIVLQTSCPNEGIPVDGVDPDTSHNDVSRPELAPAIAAGMKAREVRSPTASEDAAQGEGVDNAAEEFEHDPLKEDEKAYKAPHMQAKPQATSSESDTDDEQEREIQRQIDALQRQIDVLQRQKDALKRARKSKKSKGKKRKGI